MDKSRKTAIIVGALYITGTVAGVLSVVFTTSILNAPDYLKKITVNEVQIVIGALFVLTMGLALAMVPVMLFPILKKHNEVFALGYVVFRGALETVAYIALVISWLLLIILSQEYVAAGSPAASYFQTLGVLLLQGHDAINTVLIIVFSLGALMLYSLFYTSNLIPRWLSGWGTIAILLHLATGFLIMFHLMSAFSTINMVVNFPIFLQEMVMAVWLIAKGFNPSAIAALSAKANIN
jgi:Domain of unknown function (DUF4386)